MAVGIIECLSRVDVCYGFEQINPDNMVGLLGIDTTPDGEDLWDCLVDTGVVSVDEECVSLVTCAEGEYSD